MTRDELEKLAVRVESAMGPDRLLDMQIVCALDRRPEWLSKSVGELWVDESGAYPVVRFVDGRLKRSSGNPSVDEVPYLTASLDAAETLVPEECHWEVRSTILGRPDDRPIGTVWWKPAAKGVLKSSQDRRFGEATSPARALTAAALRARAKGAKNG